MIEFKVLGEIKPKARPRATIINGRAMIYTPRATKEYEEAIKRAWKIESGESIGSNLFKMSINAYFKAPVSYTKKKRLELNGGYCNNKKDLDNIAKTVLDALNGLAYTDDHNCVGLDITKFYTLEDDYIIVGIDLAK